MAGVDNRAAYPTTATDPMTRPTTSPNITPTPTAIPDETKTNPTRLETNTSVSITAALTPPTPFTNAATTVTINAPVPTRTSKSLIPHWSYKKSCIAAASIISAVALVAFIFLSVVYFRRLKKRWDQYKQTKKNKRNRKKEFTSTAYSAIPLSEDSLVTESKLAAEADGRTSSDRESLMFSGSYSPSTAFKVDEPRTYRAYNSSNHNGSGTAGGWTEGLTTPPPAAFGAASGNTEISPSRARANRTGLVPASPATRDRQYAPYVRPIQRESPAKPVVVRPPAHPAVPMSARPSSVAEEQAALQDQPVLSRASVYHGRAARRSVDISAAGSSRPPESTGLVRLPSIKRSQSPIFNFGVF